MHWEQGTELLWRQGRRVLHRLLVQRDGFGQVVVVLKRNLRNLAQVGQPFSIFYVICMEGDTCEAKLPHINGNVGIL